MKIATLVFLIKKTSSGGSDICLAMRRKGAGMGRYNGVDAVVLDGETPEEAAKRSVLTELGVTVENVTKRGEVLFVFPHLDEKEKLFHIYVAEQWEGEPTSNEDMDPSWLSTSYIPYGEMWPDVIFWLPKVLEGKQIRARFVFGEGDVIQEKEVTQVESL